MTVQSHKIINIIHGYYFIFYRFVARSKIFFHVLKIPLYIFLSIVSLKIHHDQKNILKKKYDNEKVKSLILFVTPGIDIVNGGVMSIASIYNETKLMREIHNSFTIASSLPGDFSILNYTKFKNNMSIYNFSLIMNYFNELESILIHIPESFVNNFIKLLTPYQRKKLINIKKIHFNILLQNIILLPTKKDIKKLNAIGEVTITTAHQKYSTIKWRRLIGFPIHKLSTFCSPEFYYFKQYIEKQNIIIISPDFHIKKNQVIDLLNKIKKFSRIVVIQNLKFEEYKQLISSPNVKAHFAKEINCLYSSNFKF